MRAAAQQEHSCSVRYRDYDATAASPELDFFTRRIFCVEKIHAQQCEKYQWYASLFHQQTGNKMRYDMFVKLALYKLHGIYEEFHSSNLSCESVGGSDYRLTNDLHRIRS